MNQNSFFTYLEQNAGGSLAERMAFYGKMRQRVHDGLLERGFDKSSPQFGATLEAYDAAVAQNEELKSRKVAMAAAASLSNVRFWRNTALAASAAGVALLVWTLVMMTAGAGKPTAAGATATVSAPSQNPVTMELMKRFGEAETTFDQNAKAIDDIAAALAAHRQRSGRLPDTGATFVLWPAVSERNESLASTAKAPKTPRGTIIVRTDGDRNFKVLMVQTGDCVAALLKRPDLVDPTRSGTLLDCTYYGRWTEEAAKW